MKLINIYSKFSNVGGAQKMCLSLHKGLSQFKDFDETYISSFNDYDNIDENYKSEINLSEYIKFNPFKLIKNFHNAVFISHHRKVTTLLILTSKILNIKLRVIHVAHNQFFNLNFITFFPKHVIAVSNGVKKNHEDYFKLKNIKVIYNGLPKPNFVKKKVYDGNNIKILIAGRVEKIKQQVTIVKALKGKIPKNIQVLFAGTGDLYDELQELTKNNKQFNTLGHVSNMKSIYTKVDYIMLFSLKEGLPLTLIEGASYGLPILCNNVGGNMEILNKNINGFEIENIQHLIEILKNISILKTEEYSNISSNSLEIFENKFVLDKMLNSYREYILKNVRD